MNLPGRHLLFSGRVAKSLNRLANLPLGRSHELPNGKHAWGMYAERNTDRPPQFGVYSTGFAIELLARLPSSGDASVLQAIEGGIAFLMSQYAEHHEVSGGRMMDSKQGRKLREVGHTDFASVLKHTVALDAFACLTRLKDIDRRYNLLLQSVEAVAEQMRHDLAGFARSTEHPVSRERYTGWPWHNIAGAAAGDPLDPIPTAHAYRALLLPLFRGKADLVPPAEIRRYLRSILTDQHVRPLEKAVVLNLIGSAHELLQAAETQDLRAALRDGLADETAAAWHEVYHYEVSAAGERSHYKPWIWLSPRLELAQAYLALAPEDLPFEIVGTGHEVIRSIERYGAFRTSLARPPAIQASWRAARFLEAVGDALQTVSAWQRLRATAYFLFCDARRIYYRYIVHPANVLGALFLAVVAWGRPHTLPNLSVLRIGPIGLDQTLLILGISIAAGLVHALGERPGDRMRKGITGTLFALITNCLATYIMASIRPGP